MTARVPRWTNLPRGVVASLAALAAGLSMAAYPRGPDTAEATRNVALPTKVPAPPLLDLPAKPRVELMGDSYTQGVGAVPQTQGFAYKIAAPLGWTVTRDGKSGSGYAKPSDQGDGVYADRLWQHPAGGSDLVVLQGSSNDRGYADLANHIGVTIRTVQRRDPGARIVMLGPTSPYGNPNADMLAVNAEVKAGAAAYGIPFIDALTERWFVPGDGATFSNPANGHPNNAGYSRITWFFVHDIKALSVVRPAGSR